MSDHTIVLNDILRTLREIPRSIVTLMTTTRESQDRSKQCWPCEICGLADFKKCSVCGFEWRGAERCPNCALSFAGYNKVRAERDQARDWCRRLLAFAKQVPPILRGSGQYPLGESKSSLDTAYLDLPLEVRTEIGE